MIAPTFLCTMLQVTVCNTLFHFALLIINTRVWVCQIYITADAFKSMGGLIKAPIRICKAIYYSISIVRELISLNIEFLAMKKSC